MRAFSLLSRSPDGAATHVVTTYSCGLLLIYRPRKDERVSWPSWLTYSGRFTHISGQPSAVGRAQDSEKSPVEDRRSTAGPRNQPWWRYALSECSQVGTMSHTTSWQVHGSKGWRQWTWPHILAKKVFYQQWKLEFPVGLVHTKNHTYKFFPKKH